MSGERPFLKKTFKEVVEHTLEELRSGRSGRTVLDDATEGSVLRTLVEAFGRELAVCYEQLEHVYEAGYLDTATEGSLDKVVDLLGIARLQAGWVEGDVVFERATAAPYRIAIPVGTLVSGTQVPMFETQAAAVLEAGQRQVEVPVRSLEPVGVSVEPEKLTVLNRPIAGIETVVNPKVLQPRRDPESDPELRDRARRTIRGGLTATTSALRRTVLELGLTEVELVEPPDRPGVVEIVLAQEELKETLLAEIRRRVDEVRPAGVRVYVYVASPVWLRLQARVRLEDAESPQARASLSAELEALVREHVASLRVAQSVRWTKLRNMLAGEPRVSAVELVEGAWPVRQVDQEGEDLTTPDEVDAAQQRLLGSLQEPEGVFIGTAERARIAPGGIDLELLDPEPLVWIDVEVTYDPVGDAVALEVDVRSRLEEFLPEQALPSAIALTYDQLRALVDDVEGIMIESLRFLVLYSRDGRIVDLDQNDPEGHDRAQFSIGERLVLRNVRLRPAGGPS